MHDRSTVRPNDRAAALQAEQNRKMAASALAFMRGSTRQFYRWLDDSERISLPDGPPIWICGDCHLGNLGPVASADGLLALEIRDLDQTVIGNPSHDLVRLSLSLAMAARASDLRGVATAQIMEQVTAGYEQAFRDGDPVRVIDAAFWRKECSSPGRLRFAVLVAIVKGSAERHCLIDIKEAAGTDSQRVAGHPMPRDPAERVATGARALSPFLGERMLAATLLERPVFLRALLPQDLKLGSASPAGRKRRAWPVRWRPWSAACMAASSMRPDVRPGCPC